VSKRVGIDRLIASGLLALERALPQHCPLASHHVWNDKRRIKKMLTPTEDSHSDIVLHSHLSSSLIIYQVVLIRMRVLATVPIACSKYVFT
jgi:hypothetical protein